MATGQSSDRKSHLLRVAVLLRQKQIPESDYQAAVDASRDDSVIGIGRNAFAAEVMKQLERIERGLRQTAFGQQTKTAVEGLLHHALLFEHVGKSPIAHHLRESVALANCVG